MGNRNKKLGKKSIDVTETSQQQQKAVKLSCPNLPCDCDEKQKTLEKLYFQTKTLQQADILNNSIKSSSKKRSHFDDEDDDDDDDIDVEMIVWEQTVGETGFTSPQFRPAAVPATKFAIIIMVDPSSSS